MTRSSYNKSGNNGKTIKIILIVCIFFVMFIVLAADLILLGRIKTLFPSTQEKEESNHVNNTVHSDDGTEDRTEAVKTDNQEEQDGSYINITKEEISLDSIGAQYGLDYTTDIKDRTQIQWSSSDPDIAAVSPDGTVTTVSYGTAYVTVSCGKLEDRCKIICEYAAEPETEEKEDDYGDGYILPDSSSRYLTVSDIEYLNQNELRLARNEIFARYGRRFKDKELQDYFNSQSWYEGRINPDEFNESWLNDFEKRNIDLIADYEHQMGYR